MNQKYTFEEIQNTARPANPSNGSTYVALSGQMWEFRYGKWCKTITTFEQRAVQQ